jgi:hypothetical protein
VTRADWISLTKRLPHLQPGSAFLMQGMFA